ncbi:MAG: NTP transferase domain-containing protein [Humidesulfovibrio sp.]|nr:NTP transferase domain-containing protein [Humidesulfovibrio sp.]
MRLAAVVLSAGKSSRLPCFKPLLRLGDETMLGRAASLFRQCGVREILAVTGCRAEEVGNEAQANGMRLVFNPRHEDGMFTSVQAGLAALPPGIDGVFTLPVDIPLIRAASVRSLATRFETSAAQVLLPTFQGEPGHPPLIRAEAIPHILDWSGAGGLAGALASVSCETVPVADAQILFDVDDEAAFAEAERRVARLDVPTVEEALALLAMHNAGERGIAHGRGVAEAALALARALQARGEALDLALVESAALLHDIAKGQPNHEAAGAKVLTEQGFPRLAKIVAAHRDIDPAGLMRLTERELIYLADKLVRGPVRVPIRQRFQEKLDRFQGDAEACHAIRHRLAHALDMQAQFETSAGKSVSEIIGTPSLTG